MTTRTKLAVSVGIVTSALAVVLTCCLQTGPAVTLDLLSYTNSRITVKLVNHGRVPVLCQGVGTCWIPEDFPRFASFTNDFTFTLEGRTQRQIAAMQCTVGITGGPNFRWDPAPEGRFDVRCYPVKGALRKRIDKVLWNAGFKVTNEFFTVSVGLPSREP